MPKLRFTEYRGTLHNDVMVTPSASINFALSGNDTLRAMADSEFNFVLGGKGDDTYIASNQSAITIVDSGGNDRIVATGIGIGSSYSYVLTIDGNKHILAYDTLSGQQVAVANWLNPTNRIEQVTLREGTFSITQIASLLPSMPGYLGDFSMSAVIQAGFFLRGTTPGDVYEFLFYVQARESAMERMALLLENFRLTWDEAKQAVIANVGNPKLIYDVARMHGINSDMLAALVGVQTEDVQNYFRFNGLDPMLIM